MKYNLLPILMIAMVILGVSIFVRFNADSVKEDITEEFSKKYKKSPNEIILTIDLRTEAFAKGSISFLGEQGGAIWFGARVANKWELVADGQGPMRCETAQRYTMPLTMVPQCINEDGSLISR